MIVQYNMSMVKRTAYGFEFVVHVCSCTCYYYGKRLACPQKRVAMAVKEFSAA